MKLLFLTRKPGSAVQSSLGDERAYSMCPDEQIVEYALGHSTLDPIIDTRIWGSLF